MPPTEKAWLAQLRAKNKCLTQANQGSQEALVSTHEELASPTHRRHLITACWRCNQSITKDTPGQDQRRQFTVTGHGQC
ncbi:hypothetical protein BC826DRAFT_1011181 [Russula brevipes]|nr:hypothetical protein BC826DRAFT_1011181 [Russula brevipes]